MELTRKQLDRQDFVDNAIHQLVNELVPEKYQHPSKDSVEWDQERIGDIREEILIVLQKYFTVDEEEERAFQMAFYPYLEEK